jgi:hypothetical protein
MYSSVISRNWLCVCVCVCIKSSVVGFRGNWKTSQRHCRLPSITRGLPLSALSWMIQWTEEKGIGNLDWQKWRQKRRLAIARLWWEDNIKIGVTGILWEILDWVYFVQGREKWWALLNNVMKFRVPENRGNFSITWAAIGCRRRVMLYGVSELWSCGCMLCGPQ